MFWSWHKSILWSIIRDRWYITLFSVHYTIVTTHSRHILSRSGTSRLTTSMGSGLNILALLNVLGVPSISINLLVWILSTLVLRSIFRHELGLLLGVHPYIIISYFSIYFHYLSIYYVYVESIFLYIFNLMYLV